ncbi:MAG: two-component sensor histidine kinase [Aestuariivirga sp.]|uniref:ATP-binding protein n=1 Tax=Aestuariivirga sp. TaxID=2650926 RepID=UPI0025BD5803|nr:ATP-binding protein [Aestuariivirga sp.]MCA3559960.1 two-component sensor histidine kinase [Aestuariivirga sp.]
MAQNWLYSRFNAFLERHMPEGLFPRALIILVAPVVLLQTIMTGLILERHFENVTRLLARSYARDVALLVQLYDGSDKSAAARERIEKLANGTLGLGLTIVRGELPEPPPTPFFSRADTRLTREFTVQLNRPFWLDISQQPDFVEVKVLAAPGVIFDFRTRGERTFATSTGFLLALMLLSSVLLLGIATIFLRNQIRPITDLARAAQSFGTGRDLGAFRPRGAREVKAAGEAFLDMRDRIAKQVEQRTAMLAGVSHDLRTILTRFKLELAVLGDGPKVQPLKEDVDEMQRMLEAYMAFVKGDAGESPQETDLAALVQNAARACRDGTCEIDVPAGQMVRVKPNAFGRLLANLIGNAVRYARTVKVTATVANHMLTLLVDDDGPGIPPDKRADAFRPFVRLDNARNLDETGTGLGLAIALDIARAHGGELSLADSPKGGLRAVVQIPV